MQDRLIIQKAGTMTAVAIRLTHTIEELRHRYMLSPLMTRLVARALTTRYFLQALGQSGQLTFCSAVIDGAGNNENFAVTAVVNESYDFSISITNPRKTTTGNKAPWPEEEITEKIALQILEPDTQNIVSEQSFDVSEGVDIDQKAAFLIEQFIGNNNQSKSVFLKTGTMLDDDGQVFAAGGYFFLADSKFIDNANVLQQSLENPQNRIFQMLSLEELLVVFTSKIQVPTVFEKQNMQLVCHCSRETAFGRLQQLNKPEISELLAQDQIEYEVLCEDCRETYIFKRHELKALVE